MKNKSYWVGLIVLLVLVMDQATKSFIQTHMRLHEIVTVIPGFFNLTHVRNKGAAFGILSSLSESYRSAFFIIVTIIALIAIAVLIWRTHDRLIVSAFSLIAGGAVGNMIDRIRYGEVVDFIQWYVKSYYWPSFNVADSAISIGVALLVIDMLFRKSEEEGGSKEEGGQEPNFKE